MFIRSFFLVIVLSGCSSFQQINSNLNFDGSFSNADRFHLNKCLKNTSQTYTFSDLEINEFTENITSEGLEFNTKISIRLKVNIGETENILLLESSRLNTTNYISSNMAEEEYNTLRKLILNDFCLIILKNV